LSIIANDLLIVKEVHKRMNGFFWAQWSTPIILAIGEDETREL
jgi:hypothetical protein